MARYIFGFSIQKRVHKVQDIIIQLIQFILEFNNLFHACIFMQQSSGTEDSIQLLGLLWVVNNIPKGVVIN